MNPSRVAERGLITSDARGGTLTGYALCFDKVSMQHPEEAHANIVYAPADRVEGVLYTLEGADEILKMDPFERAPINYGREAVPVHTDRGVEWAWTYFANRAMRAPGKLPSEAYLAHLLAGRPFLSDVYFDQLLQWPTA